MNTDKPLQNLFTAF